MAFRKVGDYKLSRPHVDQKRLETLTDTDPDFEVDSVLIDEFDWSGVQLDGSIRFSSVKSTDFTGGLFERPELVDVVMERCTLSNAQWPGIVARRLEIVDAQAIGWQAQFDTAEDVYIGQSNLDLAGISISSTKGRIVFENCRFHQAVFAGDWSRVTFIDCQFKATDCGRVTKAKGADLRSTSMEGLTSIMSLRGAHITADQAVAMAGVLATEAGFIID